MNLSQREKEACKTGRKVSVEQDPSQKCPMYRMYSTRKKKKFVRGVRMSRSFIKDVQEEKRK